MASIGWAAAACSKSMVLFTLGTGVGGGIVIGELLVEGENGAGSELGHMIIDYHDEARLCSCGHRGHLEAYARAPPPSSKHRGSPKRRPRSSLKKRIDAAEEPGEDRRHGLARVAEHQH